MTQAEMAESLEVQPISLVRLIDRLCDAETGGAAARTRATGAPTGST